MRINLHSFTDCLVIFRSMASFGSGRSLFVLFWWLLRDLLGHLQLLTANIMILIRATKIL